MFPRSSSTLGTALNAVLSDDDAVLILDQLVANRLVSSSDLVELFWDSTDGFLHGDVSCSLALSGQQHLDVRDAITSGKFRRCDCGGWRSTRQGRWALVAHLSYLLTRYSTREISDFQWADVYLLRSLAARGILVQSVPTVPAGVAQLAATAVGHALSLASLSASMLDVEELLDATIAQGVRVEVSALDGETLTVAASRYRVLSPNRNGSVFAPLDLAVRQARESSAGLVLVLVKACTSDMVVGLFDVPELELLALRFGRHFGPVLALCVPSTVADGLAALLARRRDVVFSATPMPFEGDSIEDLVETAACLWDPDGDGPLSGASGCVTAAGGLRLLDHRP